MHLPVTVASHGDVDELAECVETSHSIQHNENKFTESNYYL